MPRAVLPGVPRHLTQRGLDRRAIFFADSDRRIYLDLVRTCARQFEVSLLGYCLMPNQVHWIAVPARSDSLGQAFGKAHGRYAYTHANHNRSGHFWQNRFYSCALDETHLWTALRYIERNPVRADLAPAAEAWPWSSARAHMGGQAAPEWLDLDVWRATFTCPQWQICQASPTLSEADRLLRTSTHTGRPLGSEAFVDRMQAELGRRALPKKGDRPRKARSTAESVPASATLFAEA